MQALNRLISILELVAFNGGRMGAAEVAQEMGLPLSTAARLMRQLADEELLYRSSRDGGYALGPRIFSLAAANSPREDLTDLARPELEQLRDKTQETASMHMLRGSRRVCIAEVQSTLPVRRVVPVGLVQEMCGTATGEVLLAYAGLAERDAAADRAGLTEAGREDLEARLERIRSEGFAIAHDPQKGIRGVSAPLREGQKVVAAVSVSGPAERFTDQRARETAPLLIKLIARTQRRL